MLAVINYHHTHVWIFARTPDFRLYAVAATPVRIISGQTSVYCAVQRTYRLGSASAVDWLAARLAIRCWRKSRALAASLCVWLNAESRIYTPKIRATSRRAANTIEQRINVVYTRIYSDGGDTRHWRLFSALARKCKSLDRSVGARAVAPSAPNEDADEERSAARGRFYCYDLRHQSQMPRMWSGILCGARQRLKEAYVLRVELLYALHNIHRVLWWLSGGHIARCFWRPAHAFRVHILRAS